MSEERPLQEQRDLEEFQRLSLLFQFYLNLVLQVFIATLGIAGAVSTFTLGKNRLDPRVAAPGLLMPAMLCLGIGIGFLFAVRSSREIGASLKELKEVLHLRVAPHGANLTFALRGLGLLLILSGVGLFFLCVMLPWIKLNA